MAQPVVDELAQVEWPLPRVVDVSVMLAERVKPGSVGRSSGLIARNTGMNKADTVAMRGWTRPENSVT